jgi:tetratricopeptide (TPR) repeat protein
VIPRRRHERAGLFGIGTRQEPRSAASAPSWLWVAVGTLALAIVVSAAIGIATQEPPLAVPGASGEQAQRADSLAKLLRQDSTNVRAIVQLGNLFYDTKNYGEAVPYYRRALARDPSLIDTRVDLAVSLHQAGHTGEALAELDRVLAEKPDHAVAHFDLGVIQEFMGRLDMAQASYERAGALEIGPELREAVVERLAAVAQKKRAPRDSTGLPPGHP